MLKLSLLWTHLPLLLLSKPITASLSHSEQPSCISLKDSTFCRGAFGKYFISNETWIAGNSASSIQVFDRMLSYYFGSQTDVHEIDTRFHCTNGPGWDGIYEPPYRVSHTCISILNQVPSKACNVNNPVPPLCKSACLAYADGWAVLIKNQTACPAPQKEVNYLLSTLYDGCEQYPYNGAEGNCISGYEDDGSVCGFSLPEGLDSLCTFCNSSDNPCCQTETALSCPGRSNAGRKSHISTAALVCSIVFGCLGGILLIVLGIFFYKRRKKSKQLNITKIEDSSISESFSTAHLNTAVQSVSEYVCKFPYNPALSDELLLEVGDVITIMWIFNDGWGVGKNQTRGEEGAFPMACVTTKQIDNLEDFNASTITNRIPRRVSSKRISNRDQSA
ncbi:hypothetical protein K7432_000320 [Basidiobolus ranarum]|uniref:SH3 domain-containing protein n=1 Tax=Basidiobolus ranarum TaxID=34480 RepID=A0ABR2X5A1_9FUNG